MTAKRSDQQRTILLVEDEEGIGSFLETELTLEDYQVLWAHDGRAALEMFNQVPHIDLILLDWMLPGYDGLTVLRRIRAHSQVPIIMLTAKSQTADITMALDQGLDDYLTKPFEIEELLARIRVIFRRLDREQTASTGYQVGALELNLVQHQFAVAGDPVYLTPKEFDLMAVLMKKVGVVMSRDDLLNAVWGYDFIGQTNTIDVYIRTLRNKLGRYRGMIVTVRGVGYCLQEEEHEKA